jgi:hypothetical protein
MPNTALSGALGFGEANGWNGPGGEDDMMRSVSWILYSSGRTTLTRLFPLCSAYLSPSFLSPLHHFVANSSRLYRRTCAALPNFSGPQHPVQLRRCPRLLVYDPVAALLELRS